MCLTFTLFEKSFRYDIQEIQLHVRPSDPTVSSTQKSLSLAPTVSTQLDSARPSRRNGGELPEHATGYASFQIDLGRFEEAIKIPEQGRALLWSKMRGLRT